MIDYTLRIDSNIDEAIMLSIFTDITAGSTPLTVLFSCTAESGIPPYSFSWDFGNTNTSNLQNPQHTYENSGIYTATCTVTAADGKTASESITITVNSTTCTQEELNAQYEAGKQACIDDPASCGINTSEKRIELLSSWNLIGYSSDISKPVAEVLASVFGKVIYVWGYIDGVWKVYDPSSPEFSDLINMEPGYGYWIKTTEACTWTLP